MILRDVFICNKGNTLIPCDVIFDSRIREIRPHDSGAVEWRDIHSSDLHSKYSNKFNNGEQVSGNKIINGNFMLLIPGGIDPHVHFDTPGYEFREDFEHGSNAAINGGVTTVIDMPCTSIPPVTSAVNMRVKLNEIKDRSYCDYYFWGGVRGNDFIDEKLIRENIVQLKNEGVVGFKGYLLSGMDSFTDLNLDQMKKAAEIIYKIGLPLAVHAEDKISVDAMRRSFQKRNINTWEAYCKARSVEAERIAVKTMIEISRETGCKIHIVHLSSKAGIDEIRNAVDEGVNITAETCPHYLRFTQSDFENPRIANYLKTAPPVKMDEDREALWMGLQDGSISFVTTDHAGCNPENEKSSENFWKVYGGIPGVEHRIPFLFSEGFKKHRMSLNQTINLLSTNAAEFFNLSSKGKIKVGYDADLALINLWNEQKISSEKMFSKGKYSPFEGETFSSVVAKTFLRGQLVKDISGGQIEKSPLGKFQKIKGN